jgi:hypothetical protein
MYDCHPFKNNHWQFFCLSPVLFDCDYGAANASSVAVVVPFKIASNFLELL